MSLRARSGALNLAGVVVLVAVGALFLFVVAAEGLSDEDLAKAAAWRLGDQLSLAALFYAQGNQDQKVDELLASIKPITEAMQLDLKPFPPRSSDSAQTYADVIHYLIQGDGADLGSDISTKFGNAAGTLFEVSVKSNLLILLYRPGEDQGIGGVIQARMSEIGMPENLWIGLVNAINSKAPETDARTPSSRCTTMWRPFSASSSTSGVEIPAWLYDFGCISRMASAMSQESCCA
jgi:hypothetical protein